jgi:chromosome segregation ATPase
MTKFNLKEAIAKNKATFFSSLNENKEYYRDAEADDAEHIKALEKDMKDDKMSSKMKMSELKAKIKEMVLAEMNLDIQDTTSEYDFLSEETEFIKNKPDRINSFIRELDKLVDEYHAELYLNDDLFSALEMVVKAAKEEAMNLNEADKEEEEVDTEIEDTEVDIDGMEDIDVDTTGEVNPDVKAVQDALTQAQAAAQKIGDEKLTDQIGNTITFFTRAHVVDRGAVAENEEMDYNEMEDIDVTIGELIDILGYEDTDEFFNDNPGVVTAILDWAAGVPEFYSKIKAKGLFII